MSRGGNYSQGKRQRDANKADKRRAKLERVWQRRERGPAEDEVVAAEDVTGELPSVGEAMARIAWSESRGDAPRVTVPCRLFVGSLHWDTTGETLERLFSEHGAVQEAVVVQDRNTGQSRGFGFVTMQSRKDAPKAIEALDGATVDGRQIVVNVATERPR